MIENFKHAMRGLGAPVCAKCNEPMAWIRSDLDKTEPDTIVSFFIARSAAPAKKLDRKYRSLSDRH
jgi:hypothetical protein